VDKELYKKAPFTTLAVALVAGLIFQSLLAGNVSPITNAMIQATWCGSKDYICLVARYGYLSIAIVAIGLVIDGSVKIVQWLPKRTTPEIKTIDKDNHSKLLPVEDAKSTTIVDQFSSHLDNVMKEFREQTSFQLSGNGRNFLTRIKNSPPFLGLNNYDPVISADWERKLTEYFQAVAFIEQYGKYIRGNDRYKIRDEDTTWEIVSEKFYGSKEFASLLEQAYPGHQPIIGAVLTLPIIDTRGRLGIISPDYLADKYNKTSQYPLSPVITYLRDKEHLTSGEVWPLLTAIYEAAQRTIKEEEQKDCFDSI
jgi:hypothetical protein